jgi:hypothetical protein
MKYQPYKGYLYKPWLHYGPRGYPIRIRTKGDWLLKPDFSPGAWLSDTPWKRFGGSTGSV